MNELRRPDTVSQTIHAADVAAVADASCAAPTQRRARLKVDTVEGRRVIEALLFASESPITLSQFREVMGNPPAQIEGWIHELRSEYEQRDGAFRIESVAGGYQLATDPSLSTWIRRLYKGERADRLSTAGLETLAIIAYRQPLTRAEVEQIRGVNVDGVMRTLLEKGLVKILGRKEAPGRPTIYGTTKAFLQHFGLNTLTDLPELAALELPPADAGPTKMLHAVEQTEVASQARGGALEEV